MEEERHFDRGYKLQGGFHFLVSNKTKLNHEYKNKIKSYMNSEVISVGFEDFKEVQKKVDAHLESPFQGYIHPGEEY